MSRSKDRALKVAKEAKGDGLFLPLQLDVLKSLAFAKLSHYQVEAILLGDNFLNKPICPSLSYHYAYYLQKNQWIHPLLA